MCGRHKLLCQGIFLNEIYQIKLHHFKHILNQKVRVDGDDHLHVRIYKALPHTGAKPTVHDVQSGT